MSKASSDKATEIEKLGIEHIPSGKRHGSPGRTFTLWFAANLTIADYVIGVLVTQVFGMTLLQAIPVLLLGNILGGLVVGLSASMGPSLGYPQMYSSRSSFGRRGNYLFGAANWISTAGWFTVNTILGSLALQALDSSINYYVAALVLVAVQVLIAIYGHDFIHLFEKFMSIILGIIFLAVFVLALPRLPDAISYIPPGTVATGATFGAIGTTLATSFSYIMSWSPYASDYSRYLPENSSKTKVAVYTLLGGAIASFVIEVIGGIIGALTSSSQGFFVPLRNFSGSLGDIVLVALVLGAVAANALNIYTNSLSALVLDLKVRRWIIVSFGGAVGLILAVIVGSNFENFFENFLLILDYWITPWLAIILIDFFVVKRTTSESCSKARGWDSGAIAIYLFSILVSIPFMNPPESLGPYVGFLDSWFQGADYSYFISFAVAAVLYGTFRLTRKSLPVTQESSTQVSGP